MTQPALRSTATTAGLDALTAWFESAGRTVLPFQTDVWRAYLAGRSGLLHAPTGSGKTLAVFGGPMIERIDEGPLTPILRGRASTESLRVLWVTPMRALATDTAHALTAAVRAMGLNWSVELRTSDTTASTRAKQRERLPTVLITTPESLSLQLSYPKVSERLSTLKMAVVDEWHELLSTKRGVQAELGLARLRSINPQLRLWGMSATIGNLEEGMATLLGVNARERQEKNLLIHAKIDKTTVVETLMPSAIERFPWGGHMGLRMVGAVVDEIEKGGTSLIFTNTRAQTEVWHRALCDARPEWMGELAVHHGSLDRKLRQQVEGALREGSIRAVVCTSSLDLGVDFSSVDRVIQIGSPKGVGRLMQRAGRSGHRPGEASRVICTPTHAFELVEFSAAREGIANGEIECRRPLDRPLDVLVQHLVTVATGDGFDEEELKHEVRTTHAFAKMSDEEWGWCMDFVRRGGPTLTAYPQFSRVVLGEDRRWTIATEKLARLHRLSIGTISGDGVIALVTTGGKRLGSIEESFLGKLRPGDEFVFAGRALKLVDVRQMVARVRQLPTFRGQIPSWGGGRFPMSTQLAAGGRRRLDEARRDIFVDEEMRAIRPILKLQAKWSAIPRPDELLIETSESREGHHQFIFCFLGRLVHEGLAALLAYRVRRSHNQPITATFNDYGLELLSAEPLQLSTDEWTKLLCATNLLDDLLACLNAGELTKRQFRDIARVAGLVLASTPGAPRSVRHLQASTELFYEVFCEFDPQNLLLRQAQREVLEQQLEIGRLRQSLEALTAQSLLLRTTKYLTPMAFPIWAQRIGSQTVRSEEAADRIERMVARLERAALAGN